MRARACVCVRAVLLKLDVYCNLNITYSSVNISHLLCKYRYGFLFWLQILKEFLIFYSFLLYLLLSLCKFPQCGINKDLLEYTVIGEQLTGLKVLK